MSTAGDYGRVDRFLHHLAFKGTGLQKVLADLEDQMFKRDLGTVAVDRPVFVTSLPRAGTTLLLEVVHALPGFATHTYRNMPFILCPMLWERIAAGFRKAGDRRERAHGDGVVVDFDSPEAFEEVVWQAFWPDKYQGDRICPWTRVDRDDEFEDFLNRHIAKILKLNGGAGRYVSKNNANIARLDLLRAIFPDATLLVPFRAPLQQAGSLLRQHQRFLEIHGQDDFARAYMEGIGHREFGRTLRPIDFAGWLDRAPRDPSHLDFWLAYWIAAFEPVLEQADGVSLIDYDRLCVEPGAVLAEVAGPLEVEPAGLTAQADRFHPPRPYDDPGGQVDADLRARAAALHARLQQASLSG